VEIVERSFWDGMGRPLGISVEGDRKGWQQENDLMWDASKMREPLIVEFTLPDNLVDDDKKPFSRKFRAKSAWFLNER
jgi:hypothetical protein